MISCLDYLCFFAGGALLFLTCFLAGSASLILSSKEPKGEIVKSQNRGIYFHFGNLHLFGFLWNKINID